MEIELNIILYTLTTFENKYLEGASEVITYCNIKASIFQSCGM